MDLFQLLGTISIKNSDANRALDETSAKGEQAQGKLSKAFTSIGKGAIAVGKTVATGMAVGATAVGGIVTKAVQSYADYEQLVGGVDTLFKESSAKVQKYAENAYRTAGMSANEYMETVTSFSASLLQSLGNDTAAAADKADMAITDMSDNANKMGTSMEMIQNAYQGFAKQNYTMLDNLKLGYGGTKEEMQRLLADAQAISGVEYDISKYADVVDAIHVIQTEMGITGTTSKEAAGTISGSMASVKASWKNLLTAVASDELPFDEYMNRFVESASTMAKNMLPRIKIALGGVGKLVEGLAPTIGEVIPELISSLLPSVTAAASSLVTTVVQALPGIVTSILDALPPLVDGFIDVFGILIDSIPTILSELLKSISKLAPKLISGITSIIVQLCQQIPNILGVLVEYVPTLIESIVNALIENLPLIIDGLILMLGSLVNQLPMIVDTLTSLVVSIITMIVEQLPVILPVLLEAVISLLTMVIEQIPALIPVLLEAILTIISLLAEQIPVLIPMLIEAAIAIVYLLIEQLPIIIPMLIEACITIIMAIVQALPDILKALIDALPGALQAVWDAIVMVFKGLPEWFGQIFQVAVDIIKELFSPITSWFSGIWEKIKDVFAPVIHFFDVTFGNAWKVIEAIWSVVGTFFESIWQIICAVFRPVVNFFKDAFQSAWNAIKNVFSGVGSFFSGIWNTIKDKFSAIGTKIGDAISGAVRSGINGLLGSAESIINGFLKMINGAVGLINKIPGVNISKVKLVSFTRLAEGGVVDEATPAIFGEDGAEAVVPLEKNTGWLKKVAKQIHEFSLKDKNDLVSLTSSRSVELQEQQLSEMQTLNNKVDRIINLLVIFFPEMIKALDIKMYLDKDVLIAETKEDYDAALGELAILKGRGN